MTNSIDAIIGQNLKIYREKHVLTCAQMASLLGVSVSRCGKKGLDALELKRICEIFGVSACCFYG